MGQCCMEAKDGACKPLEEAEIMDVTQRRKSF